MVSALVSVGLYVFFMIVVLYICVIADPDKSTTAHFITITIPSKIWDIFQRNLNKGTLNIILYISDRSLLLAYCTIVFGSWGVIFTYVFPWIDTQTYLSQYHKIGATITFIICVISWRLASSTSPGIISASNLRYYDHYPYDNLLFEEGKVCRTRSIPRLARSKFDRYRYNENIPRFDHFCGWVYNTIGEENYRWFLLFLLVHVCMLAYGSYGVSMLFYNAILVDSLLDAVFVDKSTGEEIRATNYIIFQYLFQRYPVEAGLLMMMFIMCIAVFGFLLFHVWITSKNVTTNEAAKWDQVRKWYKTELKRYNRAVAAGKTISNDQCDIMKNKNDNDKKNPLSVPDNDVTCTGMVEGEDENRKNRLDDIGNRSSSDKSKDDNNDSNDDDEIEHPGPYPINIYNRGFYENWKEVLFPISLRRLKHHQQQQHYYQKTKGS